MVLGSGEVNDGSILAGDDQLARRAKGRIPAFHCSHIYTATHACQGCFKHGNLDRIPLASELP